MKKTFLLVGITIIAAALVAGCSPKLITSNEEQTKLLTVTGTGTVDLKPDIARVNIGVRSEAPEAAQSLEENNDNIQAVINRMQELGVALEDIQTLNFNIYQQQNNQIISESVDSSLQASQTFVVENTVSVTVRDLDSLGDVLSAVIAEGANTIYGVSFDIEDRGATIEQARQMAIEDAQNKAQAIADEADVSLASIHSISINENSGTIVRDTSTVEMAVGGSVPISSGTLSIQITANITYTFD